MPRSHGALKVEVWEAASEFRRLPLEVQWAYVMLISQPQINNLGVLPYTPERWWRFAHSLTRDLLDDLLGELEHARYTITDVETGELLVRTFIRHDGVWKVPKLVTNARKLWRETESPKIRDYLAERHPWLVDERWTRDRIEKHELATRPPETPIDTPIDTGTDTPSVTPNETGGEPVDDTGDDTPNRTGIPTRARARDGLGQGLPQGQGQGPSENTTAAAETPRAHDAAAAHLDERLQAIGLDRTQPQLELMPDELILAWLELADQEADRNPAAFVLTGLKTGKPPSARLNGSDPEKTREASVEERARALFARTGDIEQVADWLAGLPQLSVGERERLLAVCGPMDDEPDLAGEPEAA